MRYTIGWQLRFFPSLLFPGLFRVELRRRVLLLTVEELRKFNQSIARLLTNPQSFLARNEFVAFGFCLIFAG